MKNRELERYINEHQLVAVMNTTKWKELVREITADPDYQPQVRIKLLLDEENTGGFSPVWWQQVEAQGFAYIEWLEINPLREVRLGALVPPGLQDYTTFIQEGLDRHGIPYTFDNGIFRIAAWLRTR
jgi:hypothetical protein